jgi:hypothetical protein
MQSDPKTLTRLFHRLAGQAGRVIAVLLLLGIGLALIPARTALAGTYTVNRADDIAPRGTGVTCITAGSSDCSLREAVIKANANPGSTIQFAVSLNGTPIVLTRIGNDATASAGDLDINASTTITGNGASNTIIQGAADASYTNSIGDKVFGVNQDGLYNSLTVRFSGLTIRYGDNTVPHGDPSWAYTGGGVDVYQTGSGNVTSFTDCVISYNRNRNSYGGGLNFDQTGSGSLTLTRVTFDHNQTPTSWGGALNLFGENPTITITDSTFTNNTTLSTSQGGAIYYRPTTSGSLTIDKSTLSGNSSGFGGSIYAESFPVTISNSRIVGNTATYSGSGIYVWTATVTSTNNWWGCSTGPSAAPCDRTFVEGGGTLNYTPWFRDQLTAASSPLVTNQSTTLTASFLTNSSGGAVPTISLAQIIGQSVTWAVSPGTLSGPQTTIQATGTATATFTAGGIGTAVISAKVDNDNTSGVSSNVLNLTVNKAYTTTTITTVQPDPSVTGQSVTVSYAVIGAYGNSPTAPTGNVTVTDGTDSCIGAVAAGSCNITLTTAGARALTASYGGDGNFNGSVSVGVSHAVNQAPAITSANNTTFTVGSSGTFTVTTTGYPTGASMVIGETGSLPSGVTFTNNNNGTATLAGTPGAGTGGTYPITITAGNGVGANATQSFTLTINPPPSYTLTVNFAGDGGNKVDSTSPDHAINCDKGSPGSGCSASYVTGTLVTLQATADWKSTFMGWSGDYISTDNPGTVTVNANKTVTATFDPVYRVKLMPNADYASIQDACDAASDPAEIRAQEYFFQEQRGVMIGAVSAKAITIKGGYQLGDASYSNITGMTTVQAPLTVGLGRITVDRIEIR